MRILNFCAHLFLPRQVVQYITYRVTTTEHRGGIRQKVRAGKTKLDVWRQIGTFDFSVPFQLLLFRRSDILWIPDHLWTWTTVEKVAAGSRHPDLSFSSSYPNRAPLFLPAPKTTLLLKFFPLILAQICLPCMKPWYSYSELTRRRNENKRSLKAMNHLCHHQRGEADVPPRWALINHWEWWRRWELIYTHTNEPSCIGIVVRTHPGTKNPHIPPRLEF